MHLLAQETEAVARKLAAATGRSIEDAIREAVELRARAAGIDIPPPKERKTPQELMRLIDEISERTSALPVLDSRTPDEIIGYDDYGLPR
jgi:antitoxin VapB